MDELEKGQTLGAFDFASDGGSTVVGGAGLAKKQRVVKAGELLLVCRQ
jgi:hypothetical protein